MRIGFIFECQPDGPDEKVYKCYIERLRIANEVGAFDIDSACLVNLPKLKADCGDTASAFLASGCQHVFICWDLYPSHDEAAPDCVDQRTEVEASLTAAGVNLNDVTLLCIRKELESWLIADASAVLSFWNTNRGRAPRIAHIGSPDGHDDPKKHLTKTFTTTLKRGRYEPHYHAEQLARNASLARVASSQSFCRLVCKLKLLSPGTVNALCGC